LPIAPASLTRLGLQDVFAESGEADLLFDHSQMGTPRVIEAVRQVIARDEPVRETR
jgi:transketolase C-terminal domain/subunit